MVAFLFKSRSIRAKCSVFFIKSELLRRIWKKYDLATPISADGRRRSVFTNKRGRGLWRSVQTRTLDNHAHYDQKDLRVLFHWTGSISSDKSRFEKECSQYQCDRVCMFSWAGWWSLCLIHHPVKFNYLSFKRSRLLRLPFILMLSPGPRQ